MSSDRGRFRPRVYGTQGRRAKFGQGISRNARVKGEVEWPPYVRRLFRLRTLDVAWPHVPKGPKPPLLGIANFVPKFESPDETPPPKPLILHPEDQKKKDEEERREKLKKELERQASDWNPREKFTTDPLKTIFVGNLPFSVDEAKLQQIFEIYGQIDEIKVVRDASNKSRGYAFVTFVHESDFRRAFKEADKRSVEGRTLVVDLERGRTMENWKPRRLGGGIGHSRDPKPSKKELAARSAPSFPPGPPGGPPRGPPGLGYGGPPGMGYGGPPRGYDRGPPRGYDRGPPGGGFGGPPRGYDRGPPGGGFGGPPRGYEPRRENRDDRRDYGDRRHGDRPSYDDRHSRY